MENKLDGCSCIPVAGSHRPPCPWAAQARHVDPLEVDGPNAEWYRELAETAVPWPRGAYITRLSHTVGFALARQHMPQTWPCGRCGGPRVCPDLAATLAYKCGYAPAAPAGPDDPYSGRWVHQ